MVTKHFWKLKNCVANEKIQHALVRNSFFALFPLFPMCSHHLFMRFSKFPSCSPKTFPIAPQFYCTWFAESSTLMYINWNGGPFGSTFDSIWVVQRGTLLLGSAQCSKKIGDGPINMIHNQKTKRKKHELTHELINMNHTKYTISHSWHLQAKMKIISWSLAITNHSDFHSVVWGWFSGVISCGTFPNLNNNIPINIESMHKWN